MSNNLNFSSTVLNKNIIELLNEDGFTIMSPIQEKVIPLLLKKKNLIGLAETGTGKTLSYTLPILNDLENNSKVQAIVLSPTVALLKQVYDVIRSYTEKLNFPQDSVKAIYSKNDFNRAKPLILLLTPEMFKESFSHYPMDNLKRIIIDEGDMITFDGFSSLVDYVKPLKDKKMISFFSASLKEQEIKKVKRLFNIENVIDVRNSITVNSVKHHLVDIKEYKKGEALSFFLKCLNPFKTIAFTSSKEELYLLDKELNDLGLKHLLIHGGLDKREILRTIEEFKKDSESLLIATDYVSRGLDIQKVECIISISLSKDSSYYFHRAGRAGRFSLEGDSYIFYSIDDEIQIQRIKDLIRRGVKFDSLTLSKESLKKNRPNYEFRNLGRKDRADSEKLQKQIRHAVNKTKSSKVKPGYKKKVKKAVEKVKFKHKRKVVLTNIAKNGGNTKDFHIE